MTRQQASVSSAVLLMGELRGLAWPPHVAHLKEFIDNTGPASAVGIFGSLAIPARNGSPECNAILKNLLRNHPHDVHV